MEAKSSSVMVHSCFNFWCEECRAKGSEVVRGLIIWPMCLTLFYWATGKLLQRQQAGRLDLPTPLAHLPDFSARPTAIFPFAAALPPFLPVLTVAPFSEGRRGLDGQELRTAVDLRDGERQQE